MLPLSRRSRVISKQNAVKAPRWEPASLPFTLTVAVIDAPRQRIKYRRCGFGAGSGREYTTRLRSYELMQEEFLA